MHCRPSYPTYAELQRRAMEARAAADDACQSAYGAAEHLAVLLDRYHGDAGDDADKLVAIQARIELLCADVVRLIGEPRELNRGTPMPASVAP